MCSVELSGETIGAAGLQPLEGGPEIEVGYRLLKEYWGHGYASEAARRRSPSDFGELGLDRIVAVALESNAASRRVLEKCGFERSGSRTYTASST
jgi:[ribosomal protein S5]-alanine N-acetyltransferase